MCFHLLTVCARAGDSGRAMPAGTARRGQAHCQSPPCGQRCPPGIVISENGSTYITESPLVKELLGSLMPKSRCQPSGWPCLVPVFRVHCAVPKCKGHRAVAVLGEQEEREHKKSSKLSNRILRSASDGGGESPAPLHPPPSAASVPPAHLLSFGNAARYCPRP